jgi:hypothetical protein
MVDVANEVELGENHVDTGNGGGKLRVGRIEVDALRFTSIQHHQVIGRLLQLTRLMGRSSPETATQIGQARMMEER